MDLGFILVTIVALIYVRKDFATQRDIKWLSLRIRGSLSEAVANDGIASRSLEINRLNQLVSAAFIKSSNYARRRESLEREYEKGACLFGSPDPVGKALSLLWRNFCSFSVGVAYYSRQGDVYRYEGKSFLSRLKGATSLLANTKDSGFVEFASELGVGSVYLQRVNENDVFVVFFRNSSQITSSNISTSVRALSHQVSNSLLVASELKAKERQADLYFGLSHDLKAPGNTAFFALKELQSRGVKDESGLLGIIESSLSEQQLLIGDILELSKYQNGDLFTNSERFSLSRLLRDVRSGFSSWAYQYNGELRLELPCMEVLVDADERQLKRIVCNLITNAFKYGGGGEVVLSLNVQSGGVVVSVRDSGLGLDEGQCEGVFSAFSRFNEDRSIEGVGLGLYICSLLAEANNCELGYKKEEYSEFYFSMKVAETLECSGADSGVVESALIVDDDPLVTRAVKRQLMCTVKNITTANSVGEALQLLRSNSFSIIITDYFIGSDTPESFLVHATNTPVVLLAGDSVECNFPISSRIEKGRGFEKVREIVIQIAN